MNSQGYAPLTRNEDDRASLDARTTTSTATSARELVEAWWEGKLPSAWRHTLGILLLLVTVVLWTASNFLASTIFADNTYSKPYFVTYVNTAFFLIPLIPSFIGYSHHNREEITELGTLWKTKVLRYSDKGNKNPEEADSFLKPDDEDVARSSLDDPSTSAAGPSTDSPTAHLVSDPSAPLTLTQTARVALEFCFVWFLANYFTAACLEYTTVASSTILTSTSSIWTLIFGSLLRVERFSVRKLLGVLASLTGVILISTVDMSGKNDENRGTFPHKSQREIAIGDTLAFLSAVLYGIYTVMIKKRIGDEGRINMPLFFGFVGLFNVILLWPGLVLLHLTGIETFEMPPTTRVLVIVIVNSTSSLVSDICWAYAMLLTSPLVVTVGLSLTIPLSLIGQMVLDSQYSSLLYWVGAAVVFLSFLFINHEESKDEAVQEADIIQAREESHMTA